MNKLIIYFLFLPFLLFGQEKETNLIVGTSFTYLPIFEQTHPIYNTESTDLEYTWTLNLGYQIHPIYRISLQNKFITFKVPSSPIGTASITGITHQFNLIPETKHEITINLGSHFGNYCRCNEQLQKTNVFKFYLHWGIGGSIWISPHFDIDLAFNSYYMTPKYKAVENFSYTQYILGIDYFFRKRKK